MKIVTDAKELTPREVRALALVMDFFPDVKVDVEPEKRRQEAK